MTDLSTIKQGDTIDVPGLGPRRVSLARKAQKCWGWYGRGGPHIQPGSLYVRTTADADYAGGNALCPCCLDCLNPPEGAPKP